jgi:hypothetical protein
MCNPAFVDWQQLGKYIPTATNTRQTIEEMLDASIFYTAHVL